MFIDHLDFLLCTMPVQVGCLFFFWVFLFLLIVSRIILYMIDSRVCGLNVLQVFSSILCLIFSTCQVSFGENKFLNLRLSNILYFFSLLQLFVILRNSAHLRVC